MAGGKVEVIDSKGCSRFLVGISSSFPSLGSSHSFEPMSPASSAVSDHTVRGSGPFSGLVICVTGLSKEARKQVMAATERLGGQYSPVLHPQCTHLVVQSFGGRKLEHALKHGSKNGLYVVTLGWFVDSVRRNVRLSESLYNAKSVGENGLPVGEWNQLVGFAANENSCLPSMFREDNKAPTMTWQPHLQHSGKESSGNKGPVLASYCIYIDSNVSTEMQKKVTDAAAGEGAAILDHWFIGCRASHVVCEGPSIRRYIGHTNNLVTPLWILKTVKEKHMQRLVHMSVDLARQVGVMLENAQNCVSDQDMNRQGGAQDALNSMEPLPHRRTKQSLEKKQQIVDLAKMGVRTRRGRRMQSCQTPIRPITPSSLLESICWSISEPTSTACIYTDSSLIDDVVEQHTSEFFDARADGRDSEALFANFSRPLRESERGEVIFKNHFLTILFPIDRFGEMGPSSRTFFGDSGFTCLQVLDHIYAFYQDNMSADEIDAAIDTDSRHADCLLLIYASKESVECGFVPFKRIDFLGSRRSFEMLKRVNGDNNSNVYELLIRA
ncbi:uncharacterized protein LOC131227136 [Magnolia sinica]|uniref:uncharacterized protein LOC131227136 n=1 Tax=Magnolia sinica TaxID=86752 RepID=UPI00265A6629|nr:uncharacterized protein LOC131227136 [Magnolia sinica]